MVTILKRINPYASESGKPYYVIEALSTDDTFPADMGNGSQIHEIDTGKDYRYDEENSILIPQNSGNGRTSLYGAVITLGDAVTYDGTEKTQSVASVVLSDETLTAGTDYTVYDNKATEVGEYTLHIMGAGSYTGVIGKEWTLGKGTGSVSASPSSLSLTDTAGTSDLTVTGDGEVSVSSSAEAVATAAVEGTTVTVTPVAEGSATVTVTLAESDHYTGGTDTIAVTVTAPESEG